MLPFQNKHTSHFNFKQIGDDFLLANDAGKLLIITSHEFQAFLDGTLAENSRLYEPLLSKGFLLHDESAKNALVDNVRKAKSFLFEGPQLHIFVLTNSCNQACLYCQASGTQSNKAHMTRDIAQAAVDIALSCPSANLTFEFQGGEPLLNFDVLRFIVEYTTKNKPQAKNIAFNLVTNLTLINADAMNFLIEHDVSICTSVDGPQALHDANRSHGQTGVFSLVKRNIEKINACYEKGDSRRRVEALMTTTKNSLQKAEEIINLYIELGIETITIRPLTPLGKALENWDEIGYTPAEFLHFYNVCLDYIEVCNKRGDRLKEGHFEIFKRKLFAAGNANHMEFRSPCGGGIGQLAYNFDGNIYTCDEGRMLAEMGNGSFMLGNVSQNEYRSLIENPVTLSLCSSSCLESLPGCTDCVYSPFCGNCPVINLANGNSIFAKMSDNYRCKLNKGMFDIYIDRIKDTLTS